jgi:hypothetical protein
MEDGRGTRWKGGLMAVKVRTEGIGGEDRRRQSSGGATRPVLAGANVWPEKDR